MFTIELALKHTAIPLAIQKKTQEAAESTYQMVIDALQNGHPTLLEVTCDQQPHKKIGVAVGELAAVQMFEKTSTATASGRPPGFFAMAPEPAND